MIQKLLRFKTTIPFLDALLTQNTPDNINLWSHNKDFQYEYMFPPTQCASYTTKLHATYFLKKNLSINSQGHLIGKS